MFPLMHGFSAEALGCDWSNVWLWVELTLTDGVYCLDNILISYHILLLRHYNPKLHHSPLEGAINTK